SGPWLGRAILGWMRLVGLEVGDGSVSIALMLSAGILGLAVTWLSVRGPARRASQIPPLAAMRRGASSQVDPLEMGPRNLRPWMGAGLLGSLALYIIIAPPGSWSGAHPPWDLNLAGILLLGWAVGWWLLAPAAIRWLSSLVSSWLTRRGTVLARLLADGLQRQPGRVTGGALAFAVGLMTLVGTDGILGFTNNGIVRQSAQAALQQTAWFVYPFDRSTGLAQLGSFGVGAESLSWETVAAVEKLVEGRAIVEPSYVVVVPEISAPMPGFPSNIVNFEWMQAAGNYRLLEGDWETTLELMDSECGLFVAPPVAGQHGVGVGDEIVVQGLNGPVRCVVAGIGGGGFVPMSQIGLRAKPLFLPEDEPPFTLSVIPNAGVDLVDLEADLYALAEASGGTIFISKPVEEIKAIFDTSDQLQGMLSTLLMLIVVAAALGMINATLISVLERRRELALLRAVGAKNQTLWLLVAGEAALIAIIGAVLGAVAGLGFGPVFGLTYGGLSFGLDDLNLVATAGETLLPALASGWLGLLAAPILAAMAALPAARAVLKRPVVELLQVD
ncbi:MAG: FtsX-like permease family protein, partial [Anaerolineales bacterium]